MTAYTVLLIIPSRAPSMSYLVHVDANTARSAAAEALDALPASIGREGVEVGAIFEGHLIDYSSEAL